MILELDEAITRYKNNAEYARIHGDLQGCIEFRQLADWLKELKAVREAEKAESEDPDCEYYRNMCGGLCFAQKCAPRCECRGIKERCDI